MKSKKKIRRYNPYRVAMSPMFPHKEATERAAHLTARAYDAISKFKALAEEYNVGVKGCPVAFQLSADMLLLVGRPEDFIFHPVLGLISKAAYRRFQRGCERKIRRNFNVKVNEVPEAEVKASLEPITEG